MATPAQIISTVASLMNDTAQQRYTNAAVLPYLNIALDELQEYFEENNIPITNETSGVLQVNSGVHTINYNTTPALPSDLIEIQQLWESPRDQNTWTPMSKREFIPHYLEDGTEIAQFLIWAFVHGSIELIASNQDNDIKLDYVSNMFSTPIDISSINVDLGFKNIKTYLEFETAALCSQFIAKNPVDAVSLDAKAMASLDRTINISLKGKQSIIFRRKPFRFSYKNRGGVA